MAKTSMKKREERREKLNTKYHALRLALKETIVSPRSTDDERFDAETKLQKLPRDSSKSRQRNRCRMCGRSRGNYRRVGLCRIHMRNAVMNGLVPGMRKSSW